MGSTAFSLALQGQRLFVGFDSNLRVYDVSNPAVLRETARIDVPAISLKAVGSYLYAGSSENRIVVIDITAPDAPKVVTQLGLPGLAIRMQVSGNLLGVLVEDVGLFLFDVASPTAPRLLSQFVRATPFEDLTFGKNAIFLAAGRYGVYWVDIADPALPQLKTVFGLERLIDVRDINTHIDAVSVAFDGNLLHVGTGLVRIGTTSWDVSNWRAPRLVSYDFLNRTCCESARQGWNLISVDGDRAVYGLGATGSAGFFRVRKQGEPRNTILWQVPPTYLSRMEPRFIHFDPPLRLSTTAITEEALPTADPPRRRLADVWRESRRERLR